MVPRAAATDAPVILIGGQKAHSLSTQGLEVIQVSGAVLHACCSAFDVVVLDRLEVLRVPALPNAAGLLCT
jgi:hypothetical protein